MLDSSKIYLTSMTRFTSQMCVEFVYDSKSRINLTKVRPLCTLSHRGSDNSRVLIVFSANNIDKSNGYFYATESRLNDFVVFKNNALRLKYAF